MGLFHKICPTNNNWGPFVMRMALGGVMLPHGLQKTFGLFGGSGLQATVAMFGSMGLPAVVAYLVIAAEFLGAIGLIFGCFTRLAALGVGSVMVGAIVMVHKQHGFFMNWMGKQSGEGFEFHILAIGLALALIIEGGGILSLDGRATGQSQ